jgi:glyoxylate reductase
MPKKIFVARQIPDEGIKILKKKKYKVIINPKDKVLSKKELMKSVKGCDALLSLLTDKIDGDVMDAGLPTLKIVANYAVGFDNIDLKAAKKRNLIIGNTPGQEISEAVAEHTVAVLFGLAKRIVEADKFTRAGKYKGWKPDLLLGTDVMGKTVGIVGLGRIGIAVARRLYDGFGLKIVYNTLMRDKAFEKKYKAKYATLPSLLKQSDFVTLHVPLLPSTKNLIGSKEIRLMKKNAFLINTARGPVVNELALTKALTKKQIAGAALDVFECEPLIDCDPYDNYELRKLDNVILTPHTASATIETRQTMSVKAAKNIIAVLEGKKPPHAVKL